MLEPPALSTLVIVKTGGATLSGAGRGIGRAYARRDGGRIREWAVGRRRS